MSLKGKIVLVTGASEIPGSTIAVEMARAGAKVAVEGLASVQEKVLRTVETFGGEALPVRGSVVNEADVDHILSNIEAIFGPVDILVNASGVRTRKPLEAMSGAEWDKTAGSKAKAAFLCSKAAIPSMKGRGTGHIINVGSSEALHGALGETAVAAAEQAALGFSNALTQELKNTGITVSFVCASTSLAGENGEGSQGVSPDALARGVIYLAEQGQGGQLIIQS